MDVDPEHRYQNKRKALTTTFLMISNSKQILRSPLFSQKYCKSVVMVKVFFVISCPPCLPLLKISNSKINKAQPYSKRNPDPLDSLLAVD